MFENVVLLAVVVTFFIFGILIIVAIDACFYTLFKKSPILALETWLFNKFGS